VELHYCEGATHGMVIDTCPKAWAAWVDSFLGRVVEPGGARTVHAVVALDSHSDDWPVVWGHEPVDRR